MQAFGNVATVPERKVSKTTNKGYFQFRICEAQRGVDNDPTWYTVRVMKDVDPSLAKGEFIKVTGKLKADFYIGRDGKPTGSLLIIAFEANKIAKPALAKEDSQSHASCSSTHTEGTRTQELFTEPATTRPTNDVQYVETDWTALYN